MQTNRYDINCVPFKILEVNIMRIKNSFAWHGVLAAAGEVVEGKYNWEYFLIMAQKFKYAENSKKHVNNKNLKS